MHQAFRRLSGAATVLSALLCLAAPATPAAASAAPGFTVFDNTSYTSASLGNGAVVTNLVPNSVCSPLVQSGALPTQAQWQQIVQTYDTHPGGPLVLDCESLYLTGTATTAAKHYSQLAQLQSWARQVEPDQLIGWYGLLGNTDSAYNSSYQQLIAQDPHTAFFPSAYTFSTSEETWDSTLSTNVTHAAAIDANIPVYPYIWPQYHQGSSPSSLSLTFVPAAQWSFELATLHEVGIAGAVVWGGLSTSGTCDATCESQAGSGGWFSATKSFLQSLANPQTDLAQGRLATASSTNVSGREPDQAVDGDPLTRWGSTYADPQWIDVDLGAEYDITGVRLMWETAYGTAYQIQVSDDDTTWTTIYSTTSGAGGVEEHDGLSGTGRYIRMYGTARGTQYGYSLWDLAVHGTPAA
ncbi:discoidin domain-containing protein [Peterkaempfera griseoplana]|uniref:discoidin domain-containing protein n=1 Tax=Peterkaempfera griseoplana TaxID=66896 RepID=UPI0006E353A2|nr:discoidin domain-containing protein [Peterkaempfera griseoplana]